MNNRHANYASPVSVIDGQCSHTMNHDNDETGATSYLKVYYPWTDRPPRCWFRLLVYTGQMLRFCFALRGN